MRNDSNRDGRDGIPAFSRLFGGLESFIETLGEMLEEDSKERKFTGEIKSGKKLRGTYGINVILDPVNSPASKAEPAPLFPAAREAKKSSRFEIHVQGDELLVVGEWGEYTLEDTSVRVLGKILYIKGETKDSKVTERLELPRLEYQVNQVVCNNGILQIVLT